MISIIYGTHNRISKLKESIASINKAAVHLPKPPEVIIIDGGSTDGTVAFLKSLPNIKLIQEGGLHGVTRAYNRGFRLASHKYITWFSDDFIYDPKALKVLVDRLDKENNKTLVSLSIDVGDGAGFRNYAPNTPIGAGHKNLFKLVNYWSEDYITYAADNDFCMRIQMAGGRVVAEPGAKIIHHIDLKDDLHNENLKVNPCSGRYRRIYCKGRHKTWTRPYPNIWINAGSESELFSKIEQVRLNYGWCNIYTQSVFGHQDLLNSMNVLICRFLSKDNYAVVV